MMMLTIFVSGFNRKNFVEKRLKENGFSVETRYLLGTDYAVKVVLFNEEDKARVAQLVGLDEDRFELVYHES